MASPEATIEGNPDLGHPGTRRTTADLVLAATFEALGDTGSISYYDDPGLDPDILADTCQYSD
jgi:hypothetical protein